MCERRRIDNDKAYIGFSRIMDAIDERRFGIALYEIDAQIIDGR